MLTKNPPGGLKNTVVLFLCRRGERGENYGERFSRGTLTMECLPELISTSSCGSAVFFATTGDWYDGRFEFKGRNFPRDGKVLLLNFEADLHLSSSFSSLPVFSMALAALSCSPNVSPKRYVSMTALSAKFFTVLFNPVVKKPRRATDSK